MPKLRTVAAAAAALLALGLSTTACSGRTDPVEIPTTPTDRPEHVEPTPADADAWADGILPDNAVGGSPYTAREAGVLQPGAEPVITLADAAGPGPDTGSGGPAGSGGSGGSGGSAGPSGEAPLVTVTIACVTGAASTLGYTVSSPDGVLGEGEVACPAVGGRAQPHSIPGLPREAVVELDADAVGLYVWAVQPATDPAT